LLVSHPAATYFMRIATDSPELGLLEGDVVVVDRSLEPSATDIVVVGIEDESELKFTRFRKVPRVAELWGTVKYIIRKVSG
jgi:DNA polymerase V